MASSLKLYSEIILGLWIGREFCIIRRKSFESVLFCDGKFILKDGGFESFDDSWFCDYVMPLKA